MKEQSILFLLLSIPLYIAILILMLTYLGPHLSPIKQWEEFPNAKPKILFHFF